MGRTIVVEDRWKEIAKTLKMRGYRLQQKTRLRTNEWRCTLLVWKSSLEPITDTDLLNLRLLIQLIVPEAEYKGHYKPAYVTPITDKIDFRRWTWGCIQRGDMMNRGEIQQRIERWICSLPWGTYIEQDTKIGRYELHITSVATDTDPFAKFRNQTLYYLKGEIVDSAGTVQWCCMFGSDEGPSDMIFYWEDLDGRIPTMKELVEEGNPERKVS